MSQQQASFTAVTLQSNFTKTGCCPKKVFWFSAEQVSSWLGVTNKPEKYVQ